MASPGPAQITHVVPEPRLARYRAVAGEDPQVLAQFYQWAQELALALFADVSTLEVAMRSAMARELTEQFGNEWYTHPTLFDDDSQRALATAWRQGGLETLRNEPDADLDVVEGKLVASLMFGFWVQLLGKGSFAGKHPLRKRRIYDSLLWQPALSKAFPTSSRAAVQRTATVVRVARNRIAHHEHITWGVPLPGQNKRLSVSEVHETLLELAGFISAETAAWIQSMSTVQHLLTTCPVNTAALVL